MGLQLWLEQKPAYTGVPQDRLWEPLAYATESLVFTSGCEVLFKDPNADQNAIIINPFFSPVSDNPNRDRENCQAVQNQNQKDSGRIT